MGPSPEDRPERVNVFNLDNTFLFRHYFEGDGVFERLQPYYNNQEYRFEVPDTEFPGLRSFLSDHGFELAVVDSPEKFVIAVRMYSAHPENVFKASVYQWSNQGYHFFLLKDQFAVAHAVAQGAKRLTDTDLTLQLPASENRSAIVSARSH